MLPNGLRVARGTLALTALLALVGCGRETRATVQRPAAKDRPVGATSAAPVERANRSTWASHILISTNAARQAIARKDRAAAEGAVQEALGFADKLGASGTAAIYSELSRVSVVGPVATGKEKSNSPAPDAIKALSGGYTRISLDVGLAHAQLNAAKADLSRGDLQKADGDLRAIEGGVVLQSVSANLPLVRARENLALAKASVQAGRPADAKAQVLAAERALNAYTRSSPAWTHAPAANALVTQMGSAVSSVDSAHALSTAQLDGWWSEVAAWTDEV